MEYNFVTHPGCGMHQDFVLFYYQIIFHRMTIPYFVYPFISGWPFRFLPLFSYCQKCCHEYYVQVFVSRLYVFISTDDLTETGFKHPEEGKPPVLCEVRLGFGPLLSWRGSIPKSSQLFHFRHLRSTPRIFGITPGITPCCHQSAQGIYSLHTSLMGKPSFLHSGTRHFYVTLNWRF